MRAELVTTLERQATEDPLFDEVRIAAPTSHAANVAGVTDQTELFRAFARALARE